MRKGLEECASAAVAPAIVNAVYAGCGYCPTSVTVLKEGTKRFYRSAVRTNRG